MARSLPANAFPSPQAPSPQAPETAWNAPAAAPEVAASAFDRYSGEAAIVPQTQLGGGGSAPYLTFLSSLGENGADRAAAMRDLGVGEGAPAIHVEGEFFSAGGLAFLLLEHFEFWAISRKSKVNGEWVITDLVRGPRTGKGDFADGYRGFAMTLMLWVPAADSTVAMPEPLAPVGISVQLLRRQHAKLVPQHLAGVERAATERFLALHPHLAKFPPKFRVASRVTTTTRPTDNGTMIQSKATPRTIQLAQAKALGAASASPEWGERFEAMRAVYAARVADIKAAIESGEHYAG